MFERSAYMTFKSKPAGTWGTGVVTDYEAVKQL